MRLQLAYLAFDRFYSADVGITADKKVDNLILNTIVLCFEGERGSKGLIYFGTRSGVKGEPHIANPQLYVPNSEGSCVGRRISIFSWSEEEEECNDDHTSSGLQEFGAFRNVLYNVSNALYDQDGDGLDAFCRWILFLPNINHAPNAKFRIQGRVQAEIIGPH